MRWTRLDVNLIEKEYLLKGEYYLSKIINKSPNAIRIKASRLNISKLAEREKIILSSVERQVILGSLLGDMYCRIKKTCKNAQIEGAHSKKQEPYLLWKISLLRSLLFNIRRTNLGYLFFESKVYPCLNYYHNLFYINGKKQIHRKILEKLNEFGLAIWFMDDGTYKKRDRSCCLHTNGFTYEENIVIQDWFKTKWEIYPKIYSIKNPKRYPGKIWYFLNFNVQETNKLFNLIKNYIHPSMKYKVGVLN